MNADPPVTLTVGAIESADIDALARGLIEDQRRKVGATYAYCACGLAVGRSTAYRAAKRRRPPECRTCSSRRVAREKSDASPVYLCAVCRCHLTGRNLYRARYAAKRNQRTTCDNAECQRQLRADNGRDRIARLQKVIGPRAREAANQAIRDKFDAQHQGHSIRVNRNGTRSCRTCIAAKWRQRKALAKAQRRTR